MDMTGFTRSTSVKNWNVAFRDFDTEARTRASYLQGDPTVRTEAILGSAWYGQPSKPSRECALVHVSRESEPKP